MPHRQDQPRVPAQLPGFTPVAAALVLALILCFSSPLNASSTSTRKRTKSDRDIAKIGHRKLGDGPKNLFSAEKEKEIGARESAAFERSTKLLHDPQTSMYLDHLAQLIARNSDAQFSIVVNVIESDDVYAVTLPGGHQYLTRGLLLRVQSEGELASALARGIAHTALRSATMQATKELLARLATVPLVLMRQNPPSSTNASVDAAIPLTILQFKRDDELDADYFGIQYLYRTGYATDCFFSFVQAVWPQSQEPVLKSFSVVPPLADRVEALREEIGTILPQRSGDIVSTPQFAEFQAHLRSLTPIDSPSEVPPFAVPI